MCQKTKKFTMGLSTCTYLLIAILAASTHMCMGCSIDGVNFWVPLVINIKDIVRGNIFGRPTDGITGITNRVFTGGLNGGPYVVVTHENSEFKISTNGDYVNYEECETSQTFGVTVTFSCSNGGQQTLVISVNVIDTNNNAPIFKPSDSYEFTILPPVPPGYLITNCLNDIIARDIDLTTKKIDFVLEDNSLFEISYDSSSSVPKEFKAMLKTNSLIRSIPEPILLTIRATDVDETGDPPLTTMGTIKIRASNEFEFPDEPRFSRAFYMATYNREDEIELQDTIQLSQGFHENVNFTLDGPFQEHFRLQIIEEQVRLLVSSPISSDAYPKERRLYLVLSAQREHTSGAVATVVLYFPNLTELSFQEYAYKGTFEDNTVSLPAIVLNGEHNGSVQFILSGEYSDLFSVTKINAEVFITYTSNSTESTIVNRDYLLFSLSASSSSTVTAHTTILLKIVKEDIIIPVFNKHIYHGQYTRNNELTIEEILLTQGVEDTVSLQITGEYKKYFNLSNIDNKVLISLTSPIPQDVIYEIKVLVFNIIASKPDTVGANAAVSIYFSEELIVPTVLRFSKNTYKGYIKDNVLSLEDIKLEAGYTHDIKFILKGEHSSSFNISNNDSIVSIAIHTNGDDFVEHKFMILEIEASGVRSVSATAAVVIDNISSTPLVPLIVFSKPYYRGYINDEHELELMEVISVVNDVNGTVMFALEGDDAPWFTPVPIDATSVSIVLNTNVSIPEEVFQQRRNLVFSVVASTVGGGRGIAVTVIDMPQEQTTLNVLRFSKNTYYGYLKDNLLSVEDIILETGFTLDTKFELSGDYNSYFNISNDENNVFITLMTSEEDIIRNKYITLEVEASNADATAAKATVVIDIIAGNCNDTDLVFEKPYYTGYFNEENKFMFPERISLAIGYNETVVFNLEGEHAEWFINVEHESNSLSIALKPNVSIPETVINVNTHLIFTITASTPGGKGAEAVIVVALPGDKTAENSFTFSQNYYKGYIESGNVTIDAIILERDSMNETTLELIGDYSNLFQAYEDDNAINIRQITEPDEGFKSNTLVFTLQASIISALASTVIVLNIAQNDPVLNELKFTEAFYVGSISEDDVLTFDSEIILKGYDDSVQYTLEGDNSVWFSTAKYEDGGSVTVYVSTALPSEVLANSYLSFVITATNGNNDTATATIIIEMNAANAAVKTASFNKILYIGNLQEKHVMHETIFISGYKGIHVHIVGDYADLFVASALNGFVSIKLALEIQIPNNITYIAVELNAADASAVLLLNVISSGHTELPLISFSSSAYTIRVDMTETGVVGRVFAAADNNERISYSLHLDNEHLQGRLSINSEGEIRLSAPANSGVYNFEVTATTIVTRVEVSASVTFWVEAVVTCGTDKVMPPLIVLERLEEEPHRNLVILNQTQHPGCRFHLTNHWPVNQEWLYVDNEGLHARAVDREHESIAFMAVSQIQVELLLQCEEDNVAVMTNTSSTTFSDIHGNIISEQTVSRRSVMNEFATDHLGPYDYGQKSWILTDSILYNARRSFVNLIVVDINDNSPIFIGKSNKPIHVGYPTVDLENKILPRALLELQATDADIGENAAIAFWSSEENLVVSPTSGLVHVHDSSLLEDNTRFTMYATDQNGRGLNGSINIVVRLLNEEHIAVVSVRNAFLDDERSILNELSYSVGYDVKVLNTFVISEIDVPDRRKREVTPNQGVTLQLYVYGIDGSNPVDVNKLARDISNGTLATVNVSRILSLEDHLQGGEIRVIAERDSVLITTTISLAVLLAILIAAIALRCLHKWRKKSNYREFNDDNSLPSREPSPQIIPKMEKPTNYKLDIGELKRSEQRLHDLLADDKSEEEIGAKPQRESIVEISEPVQPPAIVIQSIDKLKDGGEDSDSDEFGEVKTNNRKSVVTFNESVEKIITIEDRSETVSTDSDCEVYKL